MSPRMYSPPPRSLRSTGRTAPRSRRVAQSENTRRPSTRTGAGRTWLAMPAACAIRYAAKKPVNHTNVPCGTSTYSTVPVTSQSAIANDISVAAIDGDGGVSRHLPTPIPLFPPNEHHARYATTTAAMAAPSDAAAARVQTSRENPGVVSKAIEPSEKSPSSEVAVTKMLIRAHVSASTPYLVCHVAGKWRVNPRQMALG